MTNKPLAVAIDGSETSHIALLQAIHLAKQMKCLLIIIHITDAFVYYNLTSGQHYSNFVAAKQKIGKEILETARKEVQQYGIPFKTLLIENINDPKRISEQLVTTVERLDPELLIMGTRGHRGLKKIFLGSVAEETIRISSIPILLLGTQTPQITEYQKLICAVDGSENSKEALMIAIHLCQSLSATLEIIHVIHELPFRMPLGFHLGEEEHFLQDKARKILNEMTKIAEKHGINAEKKLIQIKSEFLTISQSLIKEFKKNKATLLIVGSHGLRGVNRFLIGSVASEIVHTAPLPVLIVGSKCKYHHTKTEMLS